MIDLLAVKVQGLFSAPFPLTSMTLMATFIPETPPASPNFLPSASGPLSPPAQSWDPRNVQPFSLASCKFLIKELTHSQFHNTHPSALHLHPFPSPDHTELRTTSTRQHPPSQASCMNRLRHLYQLVTHSRKLTLPVYLPYPKDEAAKTHEAHLTHFFTSQHHEDSSIHTESKQPPFLSESALPSPLWPVSLCCVSSVGCFLSSHACRRLSGVSHL